MEDQEDKKQSDFIKDSAKKGEEKLKKQGKKKIIQFLVANPEVLIAILIVLVVIVVAIILLAAFYSLINSEDIDSASTSKTSAITISYSGQVTTDANGEEYKIVVQPTEDKSAYEIASLYTDEEFEDAKIAVDLAIDDISEFTDFEIAILYALMESGLELDAWETEELKCFPDFIKAEACTQFLDLRSNSEKISSSGEYQPEQLEDLDEEEVPRNNIGSENKY